MQSAFSGDLSFFVLTTDFITEVGKTYSLQEASVVVGTPNDNISIPAEATIQQENSLKVRLVNIKSSNFEGEDSILYFLDLTFSNLPGQVYKNTIRVDRFFRPNESFRAYNAAISSIISSGDFIVIAQSKIEKSTDKPDTFIASFSFNQSISPEDIKKIIGRVEIDARSTVKTLRLRYEYAGTTTLADESLQNSALLLQKCNQEGILTINYTTDSFGGNLAEIIIAIADDKFYPHSFPHNLVARNKGVRVANKQDGRLLSFYAKRPKVVLTLLEDGEYDLQRVVKIKQVFGIQEPIKEFYNNIMTYASLKYGLAGLVTGKFSIKWLYAKNNAKFFQLLLESDFASTIVFFEPFVGYVEYFRWSK